MAELSKIEEYIIEKVKEERTSRDISQYKLSVGMGLSPGFVGNVENPKRPEKYNIRHLNLIAKVLDCSPKLFWPDTPIK